MKYYMLAVALLAALATNAQQILSGADYIYKYQVGVGKTNANPANVAPAETNPAAWLEIGKDTTNKGVIIPRVLDTSVIASPTKGLLIYVIPAGALYYRTATKWERISSGGTLTDYVRKSDSTVYYYPLNSNPKGYLAQESDPIAINKTVRLIQGAGVIIGGGTQTVNTNPTFTISGDFNTALWNANKLRGIDIQATTPTNGQVLQYNGSVWLPATVGSAGTVTSVGLSMPSDLYNVSGSPVTTSGTLATTVKNQLAKTFWAAPTATSGAPGFRQIVYNDFPLSGALLGTYGSDTSAPQIVVNDRGVITSVQNMPFNYIKNGTTQQPASNFWISGVGRANIFATFNGTTGSGVGHYTMNNGTELRWATGMSGNETGGNNGSDYDIWAYPNGGGGSPIGNRFHIDRDSGLVGLNNRSPKAILHMNGPGATTIVQDTGTISATSGGNLALYTTGVPTLANFRLGGVKMGAGLSNGVFRNSALVEAYSEADWTEDVSHPTNVRIYTTPAGSTTPQERVRVSADGTLNVLGNIRLPANGTPAAGKVLTAVDGVGNATWQTSISQVIMLKDFFTDAANSSSGTYSQLYLFSIPSNTLTVNGDKITADYGGIFAANANTKGVQVFINGTGSGASNEGAWNGAWTTRVVFIRTGTTTGRFLADFGVLGQRQINLTGLDFTSAISFALWGKGDAPSDVTARLGTIIKYNAAP